MVPHQTWIMPWQMNLAICYPGQFHSILVLTTGQNETVSLDEKSGESVCDSRFVSTLPLGVVQHRLAPWRICHSSPTITRLFVPPVVSRRSATKKSRLRNLPGSAPRYYCHSDMRRIAPLIQPTDRTTHPARRRQTVVKEIIVRRLTKTCHWKLPITRQ